MLLKKSSTTKLHGNEPCGKSKTVQQHQQKSVWLFANWRKKFCILVNWNEQEEIWNESTTTTSIFDYQLVGKQAVIAASQPASWKLNKQKDGKNNTNAQLGQMSIIIIIIIIIIIWHAGPAGSLAEALSIRLAVRRKLPNDVY
ncbi:hypothetical protein Tsp_13750 [Trichinella spiralis]|uniref:hypothetical protein n=1 Tax=Trichinella spiralis TaxID=6334 RepID=UPI0001EFD851|nr:hypothetical protein Tsp_13750 [Trichinella spiralis]